MSNNLSNINRQSQSQSNYHLFSKTKLIADKFNILKTILLKGYYSLFFREVLRRLYSNDYSYGFLYDLTTTINSQENKVFLRTRFVMKEDIEQFFSLNEAKLNNNEFKDRMIRMLMYKAKINTCYVAITEDNTACHMFWLIGPKENKKIKEFFKGGFPTLAKNEFLIEGLFTPKNYRRQGNMVNALTLALIRAKKLGANRVIAYVRRSNIHSIKGFVRVSFVPFQIRRDCWRLFKRRLFFESINNNTRRDLFNTIK